MIMQAVRAGFGYFQREAGYTRTGSHHARAGGRETGQWREADLAVAHWLQHTSRDGDMQLHVHSQIAHVARTGVDGKWRAPDSLGYAEHVGAVAAITAQHLEEALSGRFGLEWTAREDGNGFEIKGVSQEMMALFSSRRQAITADARERAARFEERYGRAPSQRELAQLAQASNFATRKGKEGALDLAEAHAGWADRLARTLGVPLASVAPSVWHADAHRAGAAVPRRTRSRKASSWPARRSGRSRWRSRRSPRGPGRTWSSTWDGSCPGPAGTRRPRRGCWRRRRTGSCARSGAGAVPGGPQPGRPAGRPGSRGRPQRLPAPRRRPVRHARAAEHGGGHGRAGAGRGRAADDTRGRRGRARRGSRAARARPGRGAGDAESDAEDAGNGSGLREDQAAAALSVLADGRRVSVINAPAGAGKTRVLAGSRRRGGRRASAPSSASPRRSPRATPSPRAGSSLTTAPGSSATCPAGAARRAICPSAREPFSRSTRRR